MMTGIRGDDARQVKQFHWYGRFMNRPNDGKVSLVGAIHESPLEMEYVGLIGAVHELPLPGTHMVL